MATLKQRIAAAAGAGAVGMATVLISGFEGDALRPYRDSVGIWTVCRGHTGHVDPNRRYSNAQCEDFFRSDLGQAFDVLARTVTVTLPDSRRAALASFVFNVGGSRFAQSTLLRKLNAGDASGACAELSRWVFAGGKDCRVLDSNCRGIVTRRAAERELCEQDL